MLNPIHAGFSLGVISLLFFSDLLMSQLVIGSVCVFALFVMRRTAYSSSACWFIVSVIIGFLVITTSVSNYQQHVIAKSLEKKRVTIVGRVIHAVQPKPLGVKFQFMVESWDGVESDGVNTLPQKVILSWYRHVPDIEINQRWRLTVSLKQPHGLANHGSFDYEKWLMSQRIHAVGYVVSGERLTDPSNFFSFQEKRKQLIQRCQQQLADRLRGDILLALLTAHRGNIQTEDYDVLTHTGTNHLMAISGLHVGMVAGLFYFIVLRLWRLSATACRWLPAQTVAAITAMLTAITYSAAAGFSVPTQRAMIMICVMMMAAFLKSKPSLTDRILLALSLILLIDPLSILSMSFWLSFLALVSVIYVGQYQSSSRAKQILSQHWRLNLLLAPITLWFFQKTSLISPVANLVAIPWVGFIVLPSAFLAMLMMFVNESLSQLLFQLSGMSVELLWRGLEWMCHWPVALFSWVMRDFIQCVFIVIGMGLLLSARGLPVKCLSGLWFVAALCYQTQSDAIAHGDFEVNTIDVGQGLGMVVRTQHHILIFDTGPRWGDSYDSGAQVMLPFLMHHRWLDIDAIVISHGDMDHIGGLPALMSSLKVKRLISNEMIREYPQTEACYAQQSWQWDGVRFHVMSPPKRYQSTRNNRSCVLMIDNGYSSALLTGDIEKQAESLIVSNYRQQLSADLLIAPHHGSRTSSSADFVAAVAPLSVVYPVGYLNRFRFPSKTVVDRYRKINAQQMLTSDFGTVTFHFYGDGSPWKWKTFRQKHPKWWRKPAKFIEDP